MSWKPELKTHAFLSGKGIEQRDGEQWSVSALTVGECSTDELLSQVYTANRVLWISEQLVSDRVRSLFGQKSEAYEVSIRQRDNAPSWEATIQPKGDKLRMTVMSYLTFAEEWHLGAFDLETAEKAITKFQTMFETSVNFRPSGVGHHIIKDQYIQMPGKQETVKRVGEIEAPSDLSVFDQRYSDRAVLWVRPLTGDEARMKYLHSYDKNASYLSACSVNLGVGDYRHVVKPRYDKETKETPGIWKLKFPAQPMNPLFPPINPRQEWFYTPVVSLLASPEVGCEFEIEEAYLFADRKKVLATWSAKTTDLLNELRASSLIEDKAVREMVKTVYTKAIGYFARKVESRNHIYRPDWRGTIIAEANKRLYWNMLKVRDLAGLFPVAVYDDCVFYASDEADAVKATPMLTEKNLSHIYKHKGSYDLQAANGAGLFDGRVMDFIKPIQNFEV